MRARWTGLLAAVVAAATLAPAAPSPAAAAGAAEPGRIHLVTLDGPGTAGYTGPLTRPAQRRVLLERQDDVLLRAGVAEATYRWTTALNGFAAVLTRDEAAALAADPAVAAVEENAVRPLAATPATAPGPAGSTAVRGGRGTVLGVVDSGIWPSSPVFADVPGLGPRPRGFRGPCQPGEGWSADTCVGKVVGARWFVAGFGEDRLGSAASLSARDDTGHGTATASVAAGNAGVTVSLPGHRFADHAGVAPQARVAAYKACWSAPDPDDDGCATADLVTAIDRATLDGVDVLSLAVSGSAEPDTVERALLGAAEAGVMVVAAAGNEGRAAYAAHGSPWVTTVGAAVTDRWRGRLAPAGLTGAMVGGRSVGPARLVVARTAATAGASADEAARCEPGSLDAARTAGAVVVCERGGVARVAKSATVRQARGAGMVLVNTRAGRVESDLHAVPTLHLTRSEGRALAAWHREHPRARVTLRPLGDRRVPSRVTSWSPSGDPTGPVVKPDLVAPGGGLLAAVPPSVRSTRWDFLTGTSAATAWTAGLALRLAARKGWTADRVRSALATTATPVAAGDAALRQGAGLPSAGRAARAGLGYLTPPGSFRAWLEDRSRPLNVPSVLLSGEATGTRRTVTNLTGRTATFTAEVTGLTDHDVTVRPATLRLRPGRSATFRVVVAHPEGVRPLDDGWLTWRGPGTTDRVAIVIAR